MSEHRDIDETHPVLAAFLMAVAGGLLLLGVVAMFG